MTFAEKLAAMIQHMPPGASVSLPVDWLRAELEAEAEGQGTAAGVLEASLEDLSVPEVCQLVKRKPSTVRGWLADGKIPEAYLLQGRDWRVPRAALRRFLDRGGKTAARRDGVRPTQRRTDLGSWRQAVRT